LDRNVEQRNTIREEHVEHVVRVAAVRGRTRAVADCDDLRIGRDHTLADEEATGEVEGVARSPHRHRTRTAGHADLQRLLRGEGVRAGARHPIGHPHDSISAGYASHTPTPLRWRHSGQTLDKWSTS